MGVTIMKNSLKILRSFLRKIKFSRDFEELSNAIGSIKRMKEELSRSDTLVLHKAINNKIKGYVQG
jgi:hypothetical protein